MITTILSAILALAPVGVGVHDTSPADTSTDGVEVCEVFGYRYYAHRVVAGEMDRGMWNDLVGVGWTIAFPYPTSPVLVSPECAR